MIHADLGKDCFVVSHCTAAFSQRSGEAKKLDVFQQANLPCT